MEKVFAAFTGFFLILGAIGIVQDSFALSINPPADVANQANQCDDLPDTQVTHELGEGGAFPLNELISSSGQNFAPGACGLTGGANNDWQITITNLSGLNWHNVYLVGDGQRGPIGNRDGFIASCGALLIDNAGVNQPLISESMNQDNVFEAGETWVFLVTDWGPVTGNLGSFVSAGICGGSLGNPGGTSSDASIVAEFFTEPTSPPSRPFVEGGVGGEIIPLETVSLVIASLQSSAIWMIPVVLSVLGIGLVLLRRK